MTSTLPLSSAVMSPIHLFGNPYLKRDQPKNTTPNKMVERQSFFGKMRQLRQAEELLSQPLYQVRCEAAATDESNQSESSRYLLNGLLPITGNTSGVLSSERLSVSLRNTNKDSQLRNTEDSPFDRELSLKTEYSAPVLAEQLPLFIERELLSLFDDARLAQAERVLEYLARAESKEIDPWAQDDIRVAWMTVLYSARGFEKPWEYAFWCYYGKTAAKAVPIWLEVEAARNALLGPGLSEGEAVYPSKKKPQSVREVPDQKKEIL